MVSSLGLELLMGHQLEPRMNRNCERCQRCAGRWLLLDNLQSNMPTRPASRFQCILAESVMACW
jgi:hypothetical protein